MNRNPSPIEALVHVDELLAEIVPRWSTAYRAVLELQPGMSGKPAGSGEPSGGRGAATDDDDPDSLGPCTVVERAALAGSEERRMLADLDRLPKRVEADVVHVVWSLQSGDRVFRAPQHATVGQRLAWSRWAVRQLVAMHHARVLARRMSPHAVDRLYGDTDRLHRLIFEVTDPARVKAQPDRRGLAVDNSGTLCRSHLRFGERADRSDRYGKDGLCRWCGDFLAEQGFLPTFEIWEAHEHGRFREIERMIRDERGRAKRPARRKAKR